VDRHVSDQRPERRAVREKRKPRPVTESYLRNAALHYLQQRSASRAMVRQTLTRRAKSRLQVRALEPETLAHIERAIDALVADKLIDDATFARGRKATLAHKGLPSRRIALGLKLKGVDAETIEATLADGIDDLAQARRYAERRRLGSWSRKTDTPEQRRKDLAAMARAGFSYSMASKALAASDTDE
jgi:regulatory protein